MSPHIFVDLFLHHHQERSPVVRKLSCGRHMFGEDHVSCRGFRTEAACQAAATGSVVSGLDGSGLAPVSSIANSYQMSRILPRHLLFLLAIDERDLRAKSHYDSRDKTNCRAEPRKAQERERCESKCHRKVGASKEEEK